MKKDYVICQTTEGEVLCFVAPKWSGISKGDDILVGDDIFSEFEVIGLFEDEDKEIISVLHLIFNDIKRVTSRVDYKQMDYTEEDENE